MSSQETEPLFDPQDEALNRLAAIVTASDDGIISKSLEGIIIDWNAGAEKIFGYTEAEIAGKPITLLLPADRLDEEDQLLARLRRGEKIDHFETRRRRKDGKIIDISVTISPFNDRYGKLAGATKIVRDITAAKRAQQERQQTQQRLQELQSELIHMSRYTALGEMASTLAHELNQPLAAIANYLNGGRRLLESARPDMLPLAREAMERATEQALRAGQIIRRLRDFVSRGESEQSHQNLPKLIEEASALALVGIKEAGMRVSYALDPAAVTVFVDKIQVQQVLLNLIRNAVEATQEMDRRNLTISTRACEACMVEVSVADTGTGISESIAAQLFQPFITTKTHGMGLGLSISRTIIEAHGGRLWAEPNLGGGTVFSFTLKTGPDADNAHV